MMAQFAVDPNLGENLERFSRIVIETIREMSANRSPLSPAFLSKALAKRPDVVDLFQVPGTASGQPPNGTDEEDKETTPAAAKLKVLQEQKERLLRQISRLEEENSRGEAFCRNSLLTLLSLANPPTNGDHGGTLNTLRKLILENARREELEHCLSSIKTGVLRDHALDKASRSSDTGFLDKLLKKKPAHAKRTTSTDLELTQLQSAYLTIIAEFHLDLGKEYLDRFSTLQRHIRETRNTVELLALNESVVSLVQDYIRLMNEERSQVTDFIAEIGKGLIEMETSFVASMSHASQTHRSNVDFGNLLEGQMEEVRRSTHIGKTLSEIRDLVSSRLTSIKAALENKRQEDQRRMEEINNEMGTLQQSLKSVRKEIEQVQQQRTHLERETFLDPLTRIPNRRAYDLRIKEELQRYHRYQHSFSLLLFDVDHFKKVNDNFGHWAGDKCLKEAIKRIKPVMRESDFLARYGGEEFVIILPGTDQESARAVAERLRGMIEKTHFMFQGQKIPLTISIGVAQIEPSDVNQQILFSRVDAAMYQAKRSGRNQVVLA